MRRWAALAVFWYALSMPDVRADSTCQRLADKGNTFVTSLLKMFDVNSTDIANFPVSTMFGELDAALPWLSTCAASLDAVTIVTSLQTSTSLKTCIEEFASRTIDPMSEDLDYQLRQSVCSVYPSSIPCAKSAVNEILYFNMKNTDGCCDALLDKFVELFSDPIDVMVEKLLQFLGNVICSERSYTNLLGSYSIEMCGSSILNSAINFDELDLPDLIQIPNAALCDAVEGKSFTNTKGGTSQFSFNLYGIDSMGICVQPVDALLTHLRTWPILQQTLNAGSKGTFSLTDLFANDKIVLGDRLLAWLIGADNLPMLAIRTFDNVYAEVFGNRTETIDVFWSGSWTGSWTGSGDRPGNDPYTVSVPPWSAEESLYSLGEDISSFMASFGLHIPNNADCKFDSQKISKPFSVKSTGSVSAAVSTRSIGASALVSAAMALLASMMILT